MTVASAGRQADEAATAAIAELTDGPHPGVIVDSPPGAGKTRLVTRAAVNLARADERVMVIAQTNQQVDDLARRMAEQAPELHIGRYSANTYRPSPLVDHPAITVARQLSDLPHAHITIATAAMWLYAGDRRWPWAIVDEAYQMRSDMLLRIAPLFRGGRGLFVGDPGQLDPFSIVETDRWIGLTWDPMQSAVAAMWRNNPNLPVHTVPYSWRLSPSAAGPVAAAFYPFTGFRPATDPTDRQMWFQTNGFGRPVDQVIETAARTGWALYELPARYALRTDAEATAAVAAVAARLLQRGAVCRSERAPDGAQVDARRVAIGAAHRDQVAAIRQALVEAGVDGIRVDTANRLQGSEYDVLVVLHPLSGRRDATTFHLESGRLCVLTSRHRHACIVVARAGIQNLLDEHPSSDPVHLNTPAKFPDGWEANQAMLSHLMHHRIQAG